MQKIFILFITIQLSCTFKAILQPADIFVQVKSMMKQNNLAEAKKLLVDFCSQPYLDTDTTAKVAIKIAKMCLDQEPLVAKDYSSLTYKFTKQGSKERIRAARFLSYACMALCKFEEARKYAQEAYSQDKSPKDKAYAANILGNLNLREEKYAEAETYLLEAYNQTASSRVKFSAAGNLSSLYLRREQFDKALKFCMEIIRQNSNPTALNNLGRIYYAKGNIPAAKALFTRIYKLQTNPREKYRAACNLALLCQDQSELDKAEEYYLEAYNKKECLDPDTKNWAALALSNLYRKQGRLEEAEAFAQEVSKQSARPSFISLANETLEHISKLQINS